MTHDPHSIMYKPYRYDNLKMTGNPLRCFSKRPLRVTTHDMVAKIAADPCDKILTKNNVFANLRKIEYVRGPLNIRALELEKELQKVKF